MLRTLLDHRPPRVLTGAPPPPTYPREVEILFWLLPAAVATVVAMAWVGWWGREGRGEVDRETAARRLGEALSREQRTRPGYAVAARAEDRSTGVALRPSKVRPVALPGAAPDPVEEPPAVVEGPAAETATAVSADTDEQPARDRRAS